LYGNLVPHQLSYSNTKASFGVLCLSVIKTDRSGRDEMGYDVSAGFDGMSQRITAGWVRTELFWRV
jgi:hypothetical protein